MANSSKHSIIAIYDIVWTDDSIAGILEPNSDTITFTEHWFRTAFSLLLKSPPYDADDPQQSPFLASTSRDVKTDETETNIVEIGLVREANGNFETTDTEMTDSKTLNTEARDPETCDPETTYPRTNYPEFIDPKLLELKPIDLEAVDTETTGSASTPPLTPYIFTTALTYGRFASVHSCDPVFNDDNTGIPCSFNNFKGLYMNEEMGSKVDTVCFTFADDKDDNGNCFLGFWTGRMDDVSLECCVCGWAKKRVDMKEHVGVLSDNEKKLLVAKHTDVVEEWW